MGRARRTAWGARGCDIGGGLLVLSGLVYAAAWLARGAPDLAGPVSLRKPILFGVSAGVTLLSLGWVLRHLRPRRGDALLYGSVALALVLEVSSSIFSKPAGCPRTSTGPAPSTRASSTR